MPVEFLTVLYIKGADFLPVAETKKQAQKAKKALKTAVFKQKTPFFTKKVRRWGGVKPV